MADKTFSERLELVHLESFEQRTLKADLIPWPTYKMMFGLIDMDTEKFFTVRPHCLQCRALYWLRQFRPSVCPSVRQSVCYTLVPYPDSSFLIPTLVGRRRPLPRKIYAQSDPTPSL